MAEDKKITASVPREDPVRVEVYLDDEREPLGSYRPPASFELDTTKLVDGPHHLTIRATDRRGVVGVRTVDFLVRNGPGIAVVGLNAGDVVEGKIPVLVNAYAGSSEKDWEPKRAETPAPVPTWAWVLFLSIAAWAMFYWADNLTPGEQMSRTPTFAPPAKIAEAAGAKLGAAAKAPAEDRAAKTGFQWSAIAQRVYTDKCQICHQSSGEGVPGFVASLKGSPRVTAEQPGQMLNSILTGETRGVNLRSQMPAFAATLSDEQIAAVANLLRTNWGNNASTVTPDDVKDARARLPKK